MHQACANSKVPPFFALESMSKLLLDNSHTNGSAYSINSVLPNFGTKIAKAVEMKASETHIGILTAQHSSASVT